MIPFAFRDGNGDEYLASTAANLALRWEPRTGDRQELARKLLVLSRFKRVKVVATRAIGLLKSSDSDCVRELKSAFEVIPEQAMEALVAVAPRDRDFCLWAIAQATHGAWMVRWRVAQVLADFNCLADDVEAALQKLVRDREYTVRSAAAESLALRAKKSAKSGKR